MNAPTRPEFINMLDLSADALADSRKRIVALHQQVQREAARSMILLEALLKAQKALLHNDDHYAANQAMDAIEAVCSAVTV